MPDNRPSVEQVAWEQAVAKRDELRRETALAEDNVWRAKQALDRSKMKENEAVPVDRSSQTLVDGRPVTENHRELQSNGMQRDYVILSDAERAKGFVRPVRDSYKHLSCGHVTTMHRRIAETYARDPTFYGGTFCTTCQGHFPVGANGQFLWIEADGSTGPKVGT